MLFSEERQHHGIREQEGIRGGVAGGYDRRVSTDQSESLRLDASALATIDKNVTLSSLQVSVCT